MARINNRTGVINSERKQSKDILRLATMLAAVMTLGIVAAVAFRSQVPDAYAGALDGGEGWVRCADGDAPAPPVDHENLWIRQLGSNPMGGLWPSTANNPERPADQIFEAEDRAENVAVWSSNMTVGMTSDSTIAYMGYIADGTGQGTVGSLDDTTFTYDGVDYEVQALFQQRVVGGIQQLVLNADETLPDALFLRVGDDEFAVSESMALGANSNIHVWRLNEYPGWAEGETIAVALMLPPERQIDPGPTCPAIVFDMPGSTG
jgi:hypothetical protein